MLKIAERKVRYVITRSLTILIIMIFIFISGCLQDQKAEGAIDTPITLTPINTPIPNTVIEKVSNELEMLNSKDWSGLEKQLGRTRSTTLLWYHLKKLVGFEPKLVFGNPDKLKTAIGIPIKMGGETKFPKIMIKGVEYYIIDPITPAIVGQFDYGYVYDDPGSVAPGFFNDFRLNTDDIAIIEQWMKETGVSLSYTDFPIK